MDVNQIKELIALMRESGTTRLSIRDGEFSLELEMNSVKKQALQPSHNLLQEEMHHHLESASPSVQTHDEGKFVTSPMVGTYYSAPAPGEAPFVKVGDRIEAGDVVCIVEAMKVMNEVKADISGVVAEVLVENNHPVEFGSKLLRIV